MSGHVPVIRTDIARPPAALVASVGALPTTALADFLPLECVMRPDIRPLWRGPPRIAGPAFTVRSAAPAG